MCVCVCVCVSVHGCVCLWVCERIQGGARDQAPHTMQGLAPTVATSPWIRAAFLPLHKEHSVALPARGSHSDIQREKKEGGRQENRE